MVLHEAADLLLPETINDQIAWFENFDAYQNALFTTQLAEQAVVLANGQDNDRQQLGVRISALLQSASGRPIASLSALAGVSADLRRVTARLSDDIGDQLRQSLAQHLRRDEDMLGDLGRFLLSLSSDDDDDEDESEAEGDENDESLTPGSKKAAQAAYLRAVRGAAVAQARGRSAPARGRTGQVLRWLRERNVAFPDLKSIGESVAVQRAARRLIGAPTAFVRGVPGRYRAFRRASVTTGRWYRAAPVKAQEVGALEIDLVLLALLRNARALLDDGALLRRLADRTPAILADVQRLQRNQILVDEATDFSPVQLACMRALASGWTDSFLACGDFNQRLTDWGSRSIDELSWASPGIEVRPIDVGYRQSRRLNELAMHLSAAGGEAARARSPEHLDNAGVAPVLGVDLGDVDRLVPWLTARIGEIERSLGQLPTVAVLVDDAEQMRLVASRLNEAPAASSLRAVACPDGQVMGQSNDVRVFEVEHIKGLEFEAVFFVDIDRLERRSHDLFARYLYVGATRAATYLGLTCASPTLPSSLDHVRPLFETHW